MLKSSCPVWCKISDLMLKSSDLRLKILDLNFDAKVVKSLDLMLKISNLMIKSSCLVWCNCKAVGSYCVKRKKRKTVNWSKVDDGWCCDCQSFTPGTVSLSIPFWVSLSSFFFLFSVFFCNIMQGGDCDPASSFLRCSYPGVGWAVESSPAGDCNSNSIFQTLLCKVTPPISLWLY